MTTIEITPPGKETEQIIFYEKCSVKMSTTDKAGSFSLELPTTDTSIMDRFVVGSDVRIIQDDNIFRGWILNPARAVDGFMKNVSIEGLSYTARPQKILVTENYVNTKVSDIVKDLFNKYAPQYNLDSIVECDKVISYKFNDVFLFDAMETLAKLAGYEWYIDEPMPETIPQLESNGWIELVEFKVSKVFYPSTELYPSETLYPC
ncbi:hypothetical protein N4T77_17115 [Clostridium sp. CX1]|uniref:hypothetical protein n=1 Tax=Clostridium sp. CX1 TaxID=2978346 RepID=UPI0021C24F3C|nr:hypothetical protein [Clostridium sp. CX1]MCT8978311.1 hypothetical protein [Clostridium sp. CX1]